MGSRKDMMTHLWPEVPQPSTEGLGAGPGFRPARSPAELRADETTRVARELTDAAAERRHAKTAQLRQARLEREAEDEAAKTATKGKRGRR